MSSSARCPTDSFGDTVHLRMTSPSMTIVWADTRLANGKALASNRLRAREAISDFTRRVETNGCEERFANVDEDQVVNEVRVRWWQLSLQLKKGGSTREQEAAAATKSRPQLYMTSGGRPGSTYAARDLEPCGSHEVARPCVVGSCGQCILRPICVCFPRGRY